ncbi:MAG: HAMP domain-containing histidine kinase [Eubacterium sp.]|nr:HAMP domain-containing histidine kinase [Eubacterium sp.]
MKVIRRIIILYVVLMAAALIALLVLRGKTAYEGRDITVYNDRLLSMQKDYLAGISMDALEERYDCRIVMAKSLTDTELSGYYGKNALVVDFAPGGTYLGKAVWDDAADDYERTRGTFFFAALIFWGIVGVLGAVLILVLYLRMVRPVQELSAYATEIARGNLEVPLPIRKNTLSEGFTESFDMMREELKASREREVQAEKAKKELVADLSHDIKTPVATIQATCEVMEMKLQRKQELSAEETEDLVGKLESISTKTATIDQIMGNVFHATMEDLEQIKVDPTEESTELIEAYFGNLKNYGRILLDNHIPQCLVYMDRLRMEQVIDNVIGNSHKYAGTDIHVSFEEVQDVGGTFIRIRISDSGPGVEEEELPLITEKYYRGKVAADKGGYGIGMHLVKTYMERQGGGLEYYNDGGFVVELLLRKV